MAGKNAAKAMFLRDLAGSGARGYDPAGIPAVLSKTATPYRIQDEEDRLAEAMAKYRTPIYGGKAAPVVGFLRGIAKGMERNNHDANLEDLYKQYESEILAKQQADAMAKAQQAQVARAQQLEDEQRKRAQAKEDKLWEWQNKPPEQLTEQDRLQMQQTQAQIAQIMQQMQAHGQTMDIAAQEAEREQAEAAAMAESAANEREQATAITKRLLDNPDSLNSAVGTVDAMLPTFSPKTKDWENDFEALQSLLTLDNLDRMSGVLSESDILLLRDAATGGLNLSGSEEAAERRLKEIYKALSGKDYTPPQTGGTFRIVGEE